MWQLYYNKIDLTIIYIWVKHVFKEINRKKSLISINTVCGRRH